MIDIIHPVRSEVYYNKSKLSLKEIKKRTGATHVINGYVFNKNYKPCDWMIVDGSVISKSQYNDWCFVSDGSKPVMDTKKDMKYVLSGVPILHDGVTLKRDLTPDVARSAERTAVGWKEDGSVVLAIYTDRSTRETLAQRMLGLGCKDALMFDGGASTSGEFPGGSVTTSRKVVSVLLFWDESSRYSCPYPTPTSTVRFFSIGDDAKWVQWQLNRHGYSCTIDGIIGTKTTAQIKAFQKAKNLKDVDGKVGVQTRKALLE